MGRVGLPIGQSHQSYPAYLPISRPEVCVIDGAAGSAHSQRVIGRVRALSMECAMLTT